MIKSDYQLKTGGYRMANYFVPFSLRIPEELLEKIRQIASKNKRSANKEIEFVLEQYVQNHEAEHIDVKTDCN